MSWRKIGTGPAALSNAAATIYTAPTAGTYLAGPAVVRKIHFFNADVVARTVTVSIGADAAGTRILSGYSIPAASPYDLWGPFTLEATEIVQAYASVVTVVTYEIEVEEELL